MQNLIVEFYALRYNIGYAQSFFSKTARRFQGVDVILHAGDIVDFEIFEQLREIAPTEAVYGNCDMYSTARLLPSRIHLKYEKLNIFMTHNIGGIHSFLWKVKRNQIKPTPDIVIYGHTHIPTHEVRGGITFINPGSAGHGRMGHPPTVKILELKKGELVSLEVINLL